MRFAIIAITLCLLGSSILAGGESITSEAAVTFNKEKTAAVVSFDFNIPNKEGPATWGDVDLGFDNIAKATNPEEIVTEAYLKISDDEEHKEWRETELKLTVKHFSGLNAGDLKDAYAFFSTDEEQIALNHDRFDNFEGPMIWGNFYTEVPALQAEKGTFYIIFNQPEEIEAKRRLSKEERQFRRMLRKNRRKYGHIFQSQSTGNGNGEGSTDTTTSTKAAAQDRSVAGDDNNNNQIKGKPKRKRLSREARIFRRMWRRRDRRIRRGLPPY